MTHPDHLEHLLDPATFEDELTLYAFATAAETIADQLADIARTLEPGDPRRARFLAAAQAWHQRSRTAQQSADRPYEVAMRLLADAGLVEW